MGEVRSFVSDMGRELRSIVSEAIVHAKVPFIAIASNVVGNWVSVILWDALHLGESPLRVVLIPSIIGAIVVYAFYETAKSRAKSPDQVQEQRKHLISQSAVFSFVTMMNMICSGNLLELSFIDNILASLVAAIPYIEGIITSRQIFWQLKYLYGIAHEILETYVDRGIRVITQRMFVEELLVTRAGSKLRDEALWEFAARKMSYWGEERALRGDRVSMNYDQDGNLIARILPNQG